MKLNEDKKISNERDNGPLADQLKLRSKGTTSEQDRKKRLVEVVGVELLLNMVGKFYV